MVSERKERGKGENLELFKSYIETKYKDGLQCRIPKVLEKIVLTAR